jgi:uncharacterized protein (DUF1330 family)
MTAYLIGKFDIVDESSFDGYVSKVMPLIAKHHGKVIVGNKTAQGLEGPKPGMNVIIEFPSETEVTAFYEDPEYQPVKDIRLRATSNHNMIMSPGFEN